MNNYFTIRETAGFLNEVLKGYTMGKIYSQEKNKLLVPVFDEMNEKEQLLEFSIEKGFNYLLIKNHYSKARKNFADLFEEVIGKKIVKIVLHNDDRVIAFELEDDFTMLFTFFSGNANCFLVQKDVIVNSFKDKEEFLQKDISDVIPLRTNNESAVPSGITPHKFVRSIYRKYGDYGKEVIFNSGLNEEDIIDEKSMAILREGFAELDKKLEHPVYLLYSKDKDSYISLTVQNRLNGFEPMTYPNINELVAAFIKYKFKTDKTDSLKSSALAVLRQKAANIDKKMNGIDTQLKHCEDAESLRALGNLILQNIHLINKGDKVFSNESADGNKSAIKLKDNLSPSENAQYYFDKYKKQKGSVDILKQRIISFQKEKSTLESEIQRINNMTEYKSLAQEEKRAALNKNDETSRFRKFKLNDKYEVWVGKDSASNDMLTTKYAAQNDLWFHVRGASGSHTVLKVNNMKEVGKEFINRAASIAAYYSKARNASNVPVAYCEKKYVKKKKGFKQGSVVMEREKVIFVKPSLPEEERS